MQIITLKQIEQSGILNEQVAQQIIERTLLQKAAGSAVGAQEIAMSAGRLEQGAFYSLPAYLAEEGIAGLKWTSHIPTLTADQPYTNPVILLNDLRTGVPLAVIEGEEISGLRTGAVSATAVKLLAESGAYSLLLCGSGFQARHQLKAVVPFLPNLREVHLWSRRSAQAALLSERVEEWLKGLGIQVIVHETLPAKLDFASIVIGATSADEPYLQADHFVNGHLYVHIGKRDIAADAIQAFDTIVCDDYEAGVPGSSQSLFRLARSDSSIGDRVLLLEDLLKGEQSVKQSKERKMMFNAFGLSIFDLALGHAAYRHLRAEQERERESAEGRRLD